MSDQNFNQTDNNNYQDYNYNQYQQPTPEQPKQTNVLAIVGMILGIISILAGCCGWYSLVLGIPGLICSILSRKQEKSGMSVVGIVCSVIGMIIGILMTIIAFGVIALFATDPSYQKLFQNYGL